MNILYLSDFIPNPNTGNAGSKTIAYYVQGMHDQGHSVSVLSIGTTVEASSPNALKECCDEFHALSFQSSLAARCTRFIQGIYKPPEYTLCNTPLFERTLQRMLKHTKYDLIHALHPWLIHSVHSVQDRESSLNRPALVGHVMDIVSKVFFDKMLDQRGLKLFYWSQRFARMSFLEFNDYVRCDSLLVHSPSDKDMIRAFGTTVQPIVLSPIWFDSYNQICNNVELKRTHNILYVGNSRDPRMHEAINWFLKNIYPKVISSIPDVTLHIAGVLPQHQSFWQRPHVICHNVMSSEEMLKLYDTSSALVFPLQSGRYSAHVKIINAYARGCPVIMTPRANCIPSAQDGVDAFIAQDPDSFTSKVILLLSNPEMARYMALNALRNLKALYPSPSTIMDTLSRAYQEAMTHNNPKE
jgi:glycosyltransferase involved in cell wall biosynthesis